MWIWMMATYCENIVHVWMIYSAPKWGFENITQQVLDTGDMIDVDDDHILMDTAMLLLGRDFKTL